MSKYFNYADIRYLTLTAIEKVASNLNDEPGKFENSLFFQYEKRLKRGGLLPQVNNYPGLFFSSTIYSPTFHVPLKNAEERMGLLSHGVGHQR